MKKIYSQEEMEQILKQNIDIPDIVERRIRETYEKLDLPSGSVNTDRHRKTRRSWRVIAAAAALIAALGATAFAATRFFSAYLTENGEWYACMPAYEIDRLLATDEKFAHDWDPEYGDRMIKLVFIGQQLDRKRIKEELDKI